MLPLMNLRGLGGQFELSISQGFGTVRKLIRGVVASDVKVVVSATVSFFLKPSTQHSIKSTRLAMRIPAPRTRNIPCVSSRASCLSSIITFRRL